MKIRNGFVSNSSSSSFVVSLSDISALDFRKILRYPSLDTSDYWTITVTSDTLNGFTSMDNDDFGNYLKKNNIDSSKFRFENY